MNGLNGGEIMGYESIETDSLITLKIALGRYCESVIDKVHSQSWKDATYELGRINSELNNR